MRRAVIVINVVALLVLLMWYCAMQLLQRFSPTGGRRDGVVGGRCALGGCRSVSARLVAGNNALVHPIDCLLDRFESIVAAQLLPDDHEYLTTFDDDCR